MESGFLETIFQTSLCLFAIKKVNQRKTLSKSCKKIKNIMLFAKYIKFGPQTFDYYIFCFESFFQFHPLEFDLI
jgi:hypothetical protein